MQEINQFFGLNLVVWAIFTSECLGFMARGTRGSSFPYENCRIKEKREKTHQIMHIHGKPNSSHLNKSFTQLVPLQAWFDITNSRPVLDKGGKTSLPF
jgi:hypothetical protein